MLTRREFLVASSAFAAACVRADSKDVQASIDHAAGAGGDPPSWRVFTAEQGADVEAIAAQIVPTDDLPGAREARVAWFIDHSLETWARDQKEPLITGLDGLNAEVAKRWPGTTRFAQLSSDRQIELLKAQEKSDFFGQMRFATVVGMFSLPSRGGNYQKAGWRILGFEDRFAWQPPFGAYDGPARP